MRTLAPLVLVLLASAPALAQRAQLRVEGGFASSVGEGGLSATYDVAPGLQLEASAGYGFAGISVGGMVKVTGEDPCSRFVGGVGLAEAFPIEGHSVVDTASTWLTIDALGWEYRARSGAVVFGAVGLSIGLGGGRHDENFCFFDCGPPDIHSVAGRVFPQARVGVGFVF
jgi:hypothetical protein